MANHAFEWVDDSLTPAIGSIDDSTHRFLSAVMGFHAPQVEAHAKRNAPWQDISTNARNGLFATPEINRPTYRVILGHGVPYGIWLEVRYAGRYAIIEPTIQAQGIEVMKTVQQGFMQNLIRGG